MSLGSWLHARASSAVLSITHPPGASMNRRTVSLHDVTQASALRVPLASFTIQ